MATQRPGFAVPLAGLTAALLSEQEVAPRARAIAQHVLELVPESAVVVYSVESLGAPAWVPRATAGDIRVEGREVEFESGTLGAVTEDKVPVLFAASDLERENYAHLTIRRSFASLAVIPLVAGDALVGAIEIVSFEQALAEESLAPVLALAETAAHAIVTGQQYEQERNAQLHSISRVTQLYDLEKTFNSTLEMDELLPIIAEKFQDILNAQAVNLWMVAGEERLHLLSRAGLDDTVPLDTMQGSGEGIAAEVSDSGEPLLIDSPDDQRLVTRNQGVEDGAIFSLVAAPLMAKEHQVGVVEVINRLDGTPFNDADLFLLTTVCETAANALNNAALLQTERKVEILETLVAVSQEITSTLNLEKVLEAIVNRPGAVIPYERAAIAMDERGTLKVKAVSGMEEILPGDPNVTRLEAILQWVGLTGDEFFIAQHGDEVDSDRPETKAKFERYFADSGMKAFYALPLVDEQGRVGILALESSDPEFLSEAHFEMVKVLVGQATVALRNASLYREVPFIGVLEPLLQKKQRFMRMEKRRRMATLGLAAAVVLFLLFFPFPMRLAGNATVAPTYSARIQPEIPGVVRAVHVREGDVVKRGTILAELDDWEYRGQLAAAEAKYSAAMAEMNRALAANDGGEAGARRLEAEYWASEKKRAQERLERTRLRSTIDGVMATPRVELMVGKSLEPGDTFAEVVDNSRATVDVAIAEDDVGLLHEGTTASIKLETYPTRTFRGQVTVVSPRSGIEEEHRVFFARVAVPNEEGLLRAGMQGRGKVWAGWHSSGYVLFRGVGHWIWSKLWTWFGW